MARLQILDFVQSVRAAAPDVDLIRARCRAEAVRIAQVRAECSPGGTALLLGIARIDAAFVDFPDRVALTSADGRNHGLLAIRSAGQWRLGGSDTALLQLRTKLPPHDAASVRFFALGAMGLTVTEGADAALAELVNRDGDLLATLGAALACLPDHSARSVAAYAESILESSGAPKSLLPDVVAAAWRRCELFPEDPAEACQGVPDVLSQAARAGRQDGLRTLLDVSLAPESARLPAASNELADALKVAIDGPWQQAPGLVHILVAAGADIGPDNQGRTPLHTLAAKTDVRWPYDAVPMTDLLIELGINPAATDDQGKTAADLYADHAQQHDPEDWDELMQVLRKYTPLTEPDAGRCKEESA